MTYPLSKAEQRVKDKIAKRKALENAPPQKVRSNKYIKAVYKYDFLKYWKVIKYWVRHKYKITQSDLDVVFFLYSEGYFKKSDIKEFESMFAWDKRRLSRMVADGWVHVFRKPAPGRPTLYEISPSAHAMVKDIYRKLNGEAIAQTVGNNLMFRNDATYTEKVHRNYIRKLNQSIRLEQRHARVSRLKIRQRESLYGPEHGQSE